MKTEETKQALIVVAFVLFGIVVLFFIARALLSFLLQHWIFSGTVILVALCLGIYQFVLKSDS